MSPIGHSPTSLFVEHANDFQGWYIVRSRLHDSRLEAETQEEQKHHHYDGGGSSDTDPSTLATEAYHKLFCLLGTGDSRSQEVC